MNLRRRGGVEDAGFSFGGGGGDDFGSPLFTPRRGAFDSNPSAGSSTADLFGVDSTSAAAAGGNMNLRGKKTTVPSSLLDVRRGANVDTGIMLSAAPPPRSPSNGPRVLRSQKDSFSSSIAPSNNSALANGIPSQSLRDSPFMRSALPTTSSSIRPLTSTPGASAAPSLVSTPFETDASPIRPLTNTTSTPGNNNKLQNEQKEDTPARGLFTPFASPSATTTDLSFSNSAATLGPFGSMGSNGLNSNSKGLGAPSEYGTSVTVFGFAPSQAGRILARFYALGDILSRDDGSSDFGAPATANWVHLTYASRASAAMAAGLNEKIIEGCMIGVKRHPLGWTPRDDAASSVSGSAVGGGIGKINLLNTPSSSLNNTTGSSLYERSGRKAAQNSSSSQLLHSSSIYATPAATNPSGAGVYKNPCSKLMEYFFGY